MIKEHNTQKVLKDGFVRLVDVMGDDSSIVQAARISYGKGTKTPSEDEQLIRYLMKHEHLTPFEMAEMKFHIRLPMDIMRQLVRHRTANINEYSTRYSEAIESYNSTDISEWRKQSKENKQGSENGNSIEESKREIFTFQEILVCNQVNDFYKELLAEGIAREQARKVLQFGNYTEIYWKNDLRNIFGFLKLRLDRSAQYEIREFAKAIAEKVKEYFPIAYSAFEEFNLYSVKLSRSKVEMLKTLLTENGILNNSLYRKLGLEETEWT